MGLNMVNLLLWLAVLLPQNDKRLEVLYDFSSASGPVVKDRSGKSKPMDLRISNTYGSDISTPYYKAIHDDQGRIMVFICHNTDLGDGWEREGEDAWYFHEFSEKKAYPLGINIVTYALTH